MIYVRKAWRELKNSNDFSHPLETFKSNAEIS